MSSPRTRRLALAGVPAALLLGASIVLSPTTALAAPVGLGTATSFAVLAAEGITNTGATTITGDIGSYANPAVEAANITLIPPSFNHQGDLVTAGAKDSLVAAYNDAAGRGPATAHGVELGSPTPLLPGVYSGGTFGLNGTLTLDAQGDPNAQWVFQVASTLITEVDSTVALINGANPCNVVWQVGSSATFKSGSEFVGDVLALTSITAQNQATFRGRLLARNGAVTLDTNTITNGTCATGGGGTGGTDGGTTTGGTTTGGTTTGGTTGGSDGSSTGGGTSTGGTDGSSTGGGTSTGGSDGSTGGSTGGSDTVTQRLTNGPGTPGTPGTGTPTTPTRPFLPFTGTNATLVLLAVGLALVTFGATTLASRQLRAEDSI